MDPEGKFVTLVTVADNGFSNKFVSKVKLIQADNSMLNASSFLDVSRDQSFDAGGIVDLRKRSSLFSETSLPKRPSQNEV